MNEEHRPSLGYIGISVKPRLQMSGALSPESVTERLAALQNTLPSIQATSVWLLFHYRRLESLILPLWMERVRNGDVGTRLVLLYLANDAMQNAKKQGLSVDPWLPLLPEAVSLAYRLAVGAPPPPTGERPPAVSIRRLCSVWREREVVPVAVLDAIDESLAKVDADAPLPRNASAAPPPGVVPAAGSTAAPAMASLPPPPPRDPRLATVVSAWEDVARVREPRTLRALADVLFSEASVAMQEAEELETREEERRRAEREEELKRAAKRVKSEGPAEGPVAFVAPPPELQNVRGDAKVAGFHALTCRFQNPQLLHTLTRELIARIVAK